MKLRSKYPITAKSLIYQGELEYISRCILDSPDIETGGDLFGFWTHTGSPVIQYVIGPGPLARPQLTFFNQDLDYLIEMGDILRSNHGLQHIGEWHSHHRMGLAEPSAHDINTVVKAIEKYTLSKFLLVIGNILDEASTVNGFLFNKESSREFDYSGWIVMPGESPIRGKIDKVYLERVYQPKTKFSNIRDLSNVSFETISYNKPDFSKTAWMEDKNHHGILKECLDELALRYKNVALYHNDQDGSVAFKFEDEEAHAYELKLPTNYPEVSPELSLITGSDIHFKSVDGWKASDSMNLAERTSQLLLELNRVLNKNTNDG